MHFQYTSPFCSLATSLKILHSFPTSLWVKVKGWHDLAALPLWPHLPLCSLRDVSQPHGSPCLSRDTPPSSGVFHWLFLLPGTHSAGICMTSSNTSIRTLFKCLLLSKACWKQPNFKLQSSPVHPTSLPLLCPIAHKTTYLSIHPPTIYPMHHTHHSTKKSAPWNHRCFPFLFTAVSLELRNIVTLVKSSWIKWKNLRDVKMKSNITMNEKFFILTSNELFLLENLDRCLKTFIWRLRIYILPNTTWGTKI